MITDRAQSRHIATKRKVKRYITIRRPQSGQTAPPMGEDGYVTEDRLVSTGEAARLLGVNRRTLQRWVAEGQITPDWTTPGGHARWDVNRVRREFREQCARDE